MKKFVLTVYLFPLLFFFIFSVQCRFFTMDPLEITEHIPNTDVVDTEALEEIRIVFSADINTKVTREAFSLTSDGIEIDGEFSWPDKKTLVYQPYKDFTPTSNYVIKVSTLAEDKDGNSLHDDFYHAFRGLEDAIRPQIINITPAADTQIDTVRPNIEISFSETIDLTSFINGFEITPNVNGYFEETDNSNSFRFILTEDLSWQTTYTLSINESVYDIAGNSIGKPYSYFFYTGNDTIKPEIIAVTDQTTSTNIIEDDLTDTIETITDGIEKNASISISFSEEMNKDTVKASLSISPNVKYDLEWNTDATEVTITQTESFKYNEIYTLTVNTDCSDLQGNTIVEDSTYKFFINGQYSVPPLVDHINFINEFTIITPAPLDYTMDDVISLSHLGSIEFSEIYDIEEIIGFFDIYIQLAPGANIDYLDFTESFTVSATNVSITPIACQIDSDISFAISDVPIDTIGADIHVIRYIAAIDNSGASFEDIPGQIQLILDSGFTDSLDNITIEQWTMTVYTTN